MKWHWNKSFEYFRLHPIRAMRASVYSTPLFSTHCTSPSSFSICILVLHPSQQPLESKTGQSKVISKSLMEDLPESVLMYILQRIDRTADRNSLSLVCKQLHMVEGEQRDFLRVGCGLHPATEAFTALCSRFPNLSKLEISYFGWTPLSGEQLGNEGMQVLCSNCPLLEELSLNSCSLIDDVGLSYLSFCQKLTSLKLIFSPDITSNGILCVVLSCKNFSTLHLICCMKVSIECIQFLGKSGNLRELSIKNCRGIRENDLIKLGPGWRKLRTLDFAVDAYYQYPRVDDQPLLNELFGEDVCCDELKELSLTNCIVTPGQGLSFILGRCNALEKLRLDMCIGVTHSDIVTLSQKSSNLRSLAMRLPLEFTGPLFEDRQLALKDDSLRALAAGCSMLNTLELFFSDWDFPSTSYITQDALIDLIHSCPICVLKLHGAIFFNNRGMKALCTAQCLQVLELSKCQEISDEGLKHIIQSPSLKTVTLSKCIGVTDIGLKPLVDSNKLDLLTVEDCPQISEEGIKGAARSILYKQDLLWLLDEIRDY